MTNPRARRLLATTGFLGLMGIANDAPAIAALDTATTEDRERAGTLDWPRDVELEPGATDAGDVVLRKASLSRPAPSAAQTAFRFFLGKKLTPAQAAGIVGNLIQESNINPSSVEANRGPGRGIAQWSVGGRWDKTPNDNVNWFASTRMHRASPRALTTQLEFIWYELNTFPGYGLGALHAAAKDVVRATQAFQIHFEVCGKCNGPARVANAWRVLGGRV